MAVITRFVVVRNGKELDLVFSVKKEAEAYDKMLDAADNLANLIKNGQLQANLDGQTIDEISIFLAKNAPDVARILKGVNYGSQKKEKRTNISHATEKVTAGKTNPKPVKKKTTG